MNLHGPLGIHLLMLLRHGEKTGYDLTKVMEKSYIWQASHQQVYRTLNSFLNSDLVSARCIPQEGKPDKKGYSLTEKGIEAINNLNEIVQPDIGKVQSITTVMIASENLEFFYSMATSLGGMIDLTNADIERLEKDAKEKDKKTEVPPGEILAMKRARGIYQAELDHCTAAIELIEQQQEKKQAA